MGSSVYSTPVPANGALFIVNRNELFAISSTGAAGSEVSARRIATVATVLVDRGRRCRPRRRPAAPADRWTQFRGTPSLVGTSDAKLPPAL